ncbi:hypothetical protein [Streptomyces omiyaensis]|uniref:hypothetical protein n=1 Tax=Streptomyces omiyaensis TaxID=68247 RepID=UPI0036F884D7
MGDTRKTNRRTTTRRPDTAARSTLDEDADVTEPDTTADEAQELEATNKYVTATLCGEEIRVIPPGAWRQSWQRLLNSGQVDSFAGLVFHPDDYDLYEDIDPTNEEFGDMIAEAAERAGESLGKSRGPAASSRRTRRR